MSEPLETTSPAPVVTSDERLMAALAHASVILSFFGPIAPGLIWVFQRKKSPYVAFHALQAMGYQMLTFWVGLTVYLLFFILMMFVMIPVISTLEESANPLSMLAFEGSFFLLMLGFFALYFLVGIIGAVSSLMGRDFKIPFLGERLARYLGRGENPSDPLNEAKAEQWVAGICHGSAILMMWGMLLPLVVWITQKEQSPRLRLQSLQAFVYQFLAFLGYLGFMFLYMLSIFGLFAMTIFLSSGMTPENSSIPIVFLIIFVIILLLVLIVMTLAIPTYHLFAMIAGIQVVKGRDYQYPLLGKFLARQFGNHPTG